MTIPRLSFKDILTGGKLGILYKIILFVYILCYMIFNNLLEWFTMEDEIVSEVHSAQSPVNIQNFTV